MPHDKNWIICTLIQQNLLLCFTRSHWWSVNEVYAFLLQGREGLAVKLLKLHNIDLASAFSRDSFHAADSIIDLQAVVPQQLGRRPGGALDAAATVAAAVYTRRNDGYASNMLSGDLWQQTPGVTDEMESGGND